ncbi:MAG: transporter [Ignavibacteriales bacterium]|nr:MAG: transporter [Ignavibacteriales bacterium]
MLNNNDYSELNSTNIAGTLFRFGVANKLELRIGGSFLIEKIKTMGVETKANGLADLMAGAKYNFVNGHQSIPDIALLFHLFLPVGGEKIKPSKTEPQTVISIAKSLTDFMSLGTNIGGQYNSSDEEINYIYTLTSGFSLAEKLGSFIEIYSELYPSAKPFMSLDAGFTYLLLQNIQLDISGGKGLFHKSKFWYFSSGISIRIPR